MILKRGMLFSHILLLITFYFVLLFSYPKVKCFNATFPLLSGTNMIISLWLVPLQYLVRIKNSQIKLKTKEIFEDPDAGNLHVGWGC
jgi:hypothetical protein